MPVNARMSECPIGGPYKSSAPQLFLVALDYLFILTFPARSLAAEHGRAKVALPFVGIATAVLSGADAGLVGCKHVSSG